MDNIFDSLFYPEGVLIGGVDESGVVDIAGPLVAACVIFPKIEVQKNDLRIFEINDSKKIPAQYRKRCAELIWESAIAVGIGETQPAEIDYLTRFDAISLAMCRAVLSCKSIETLRPTKPDFLIIDGEQSIPLGIKQALVVDGDEKSLCVAAASIIAKVYRDEVMMQLHQRFPYYKWNQNHGVGSDDHLAGLDQHGVQVGIHRVRSWPFVARYVSPGSDKKPDPDEPKWKIRRKKWRTQSIKNLAEEMSSGKELWNTNPELSTLFMRSKLPYRKRRSLEEHMNSSSAKSEKKPNAESSS